MLFLDFNLAIFLGFLLFFFSIYYYIVVRVRNSLISRDIDILYSSLLLFTSGILIFQGWRLDPILLFGQFIISLLLVATLIENISLRDKNKNSSEFLSKNILKNLFKNDEGSYNFGKSLKNKSIKKTWIPIDWEDIKKDSQKMKDIDFY